MALYICTRLLLFWARGYGVELVLCSYKALLTLQQFHREGNLIQETSVNTSMLSLVVRGKSLGQILICCVLPVFISAQFDPFKAGFTALYSYPAISTFSACYLVNVHRKNLPKSYCCAVYAWPIFSYLHLPLQGL